MFKRKKKKKEKSPLGNVIDSNMEVFKESLKGMNLGEITGLRTTLALVYNDLVVRKDVVSKNNELDLDEKSNIIKGIFFELLKIEEKIIYLDKKIKELKLTDFDRNKLN